MRSPTEISRLTGVSSRLAAFVAERHPLALAMAVEAFDATRRGTSVEGDCKQIEALRAPFRRELARRLYDFLKAPDGIDETTPGVTAVKRLEQARADIVESCDGFLAREAIRASLIRRRAPRDPARHGADARRRQSAEAAVHGR